jgi:hypothetical protein
MFSKKVEARTKNPILIFLAKMWEGGAKVGKYILVGVVVEILATRYVPNEWLESLLSSSSPLSVLGLALGVVPLHLNQIMASTILYGLNDFQVSRAAQMVLLVGGPVTALPVMGVFLTMFKTRVFLLYLGICLSGTLLIAGVYQAIGG